jgi:hypothetical protein
MEDVSKQNTSMANKAENELDCFCSVPLYQYNSVPGAHAIVAVIMHIMFPKVFLIYYLI